LMVSVIEKPMQCSTTAVGERYPSTEGLRRQ
jgi:hypothetical protein